MENTQLFRILILCAAALAASADPTISLEVNNTALHPGDTLTLVCMTANLVGGASFLRIQKTIPGAKGDQPLVISTNTILDRNLDAITRYGVAYEEGQNDGELRFIFSITDVQYEDAGEYSCSIMAKEGVKAESKQFINVINAVDFMVEMTVTRASGESKTFKNSDPEPFTYELDENEKFHVLITTTQTNPASKVTAMVGTQDISDQFTTIASPTEFKDSTGLLTGVKYAVTMEGDINVDHSYKSGFKAFARVSETEESVGFKVKFSGYPPMLPEECTRNIMAGKHELDVEFVCTIVSAEPVDVYFTYYRVTGESEEVQGEMLEKIIPGDQDPSADYHYKASLKEDREAEEYHVKLHMPHIYPQMFKTYSLVATNSIGNVTHEFTVEEDPSRSKEPASSASHLSVAMATLLLIVLAAML